MKKTEQQKSGNRRKKWVEKTADNTNKRPYGHHWHPADGIRKPSAKWSGKTRCNSEKADDIAFVFAAAQAA